MINYNELAEFLVQNAPAIVPEVVGEYLAEAEADIPTWLRGEERVTALRRRADARRWLRETAERYGYRFEQSDSLPEIEDEDMIPLEPAEWPSLWEQVEHGCYVLVKDPATGQEWQYYNLFPPDSPEAASAAAFVKSALEKRLGRSVEVRIEAIPYQER